MYRIEDNEPVNGVAADHLPRRDFLGMVASTAAMAVTRGFAQESQKAASVDPTRVPLGLDGHSMRAMRWKAPQFIEFAAEQKLDAVLINNFRCSRTWRNLPSRPEGSRRRVRLRIYMGAGSICENGSSFNDRYGGAETFLPRAFALPRSLGLRSSLFASVGWPTDTLKGESGLALTRP